MAQAYVPELPELGDAALPLDQINRARRNLQIRYADKRDWRELDAWPDTKGAKVCQDITGRWRERHAFIVHTRRGVECVHCGRLRPGGDSRGRIA